MDTDTAYLEYEISEKIKDICFLSRKAWLSLANQPADKRNQILRTMIAELDTAWPLIKSANQQDLALGRENGLSAAMMDRLTLNEKRLQGMKDSIQTVIDLDDPLGRELKSYIRQDKLIIKKISVPIGVIAMIFESRPNVTIEAASLGIKSGNAIILKGGKEAYFTNCELEKVVATSLEKSGLQRECVTLIPFKERLATQILLKQKDTIDLVIPRGGESLIQAVTKESEIPVIKHYKGLCHTYIDIAADYKMAINIAVNAKTQRPGVCNAMETLLIHNEIAQDILPSLVEKFQDLKVTMKGCERSRAICPVILPATEEDYDTEYLDLALSIKIVDHVDDAIAHIERHGSRHSEAIVTNDHKTAVHFMQLVDASAVFVNASTRFNDGFEFGLGAELGISTDKLHCRGPMGLEEMTTYKYFVTGNGHIRT